MGELELSVGEDDVGGRKRSLGDWVAAVFFEVVWFGNLFCLLFNAPKFQQIYHDMLGDRPLPQVTALVLEFRWMLAMLAAGWMGGLIFAILFSRRRVERWIVVLLAVAGVFQLGFTVCALFMPLVGGVIQGMPAGR